MLTQYEESIKGIENKKVYFQIQESESICNVRNEVGFLRFVKLKTSFFLTQH
jgi:hypothetical protein